MQNLLYTFESEYRDSCMWVCCTWKIDSENWAAEIGKRAGWCMCSGFPDRLLQVAIAFAICMLDLEWRSLIQGI
jgi:hypothetical protein